MQQIATDGTGLPESDSRKTLRQIQTQPLVLVFLIGYSRV